ncbi:MAG: hypothetical protein ACI4NE_08780 [Succinivibrio sp.]
MESYIRDLKKIKAYLKRHLGYPVSISKISRHTGIKKAVVENTVITMMRQDLLLLVRRRRVNLYMINCRKRCCRWMN